MKIDGFGLMNPTFLVNNPYLPPSFKKIPENPSASFFFFLCFLLLLPCSNLAARKQENLPDSTFLLRKTIYAIRTSVPPKIDGKSDDACWLAAPAADQFVEYSPRNGTIPAFPTVVKFAYDDEALYILADMQDPYPDSICKELGRRDQLEELNSDYISFDILPYNDALNMYEFKVGAANVQSDTKYSAIGVDPAWDAVWETATAITANGWLVEVRIPYSALRFPRVEEQVWGINMWRLIRRYQEWSTWCYVDNSIEELFNYYGELRGLTNIDPPIRLSFSPYLSGYMEKNPESDRWAWFIRGGMDLRYGINESYTLDMMLIPDFGQVQSDDIILNLTPFEIRYDEKRQFFTEATELFDKCGIFYTRRVGSMPRNYPAPFDSLHPNEIVAKNPEETRIINATKISGRDSKGLGIGFFNAMTTNTWATLRDTISGNSRRISTQPFTNYNVLVVDQNLRNNSYVTLINTNYGIPETGYWANVTGSEAKICNKKNTFQAFGRINVSQQYQQGEAPLFGYLYEVSVSKPSGKFRYELFRSSMDNRYNPNDMGFLTNNNEDETYLLLSYNTFTPFWKINTTRTSFQTVYSTLHKPNRFQSLRFELNHYTQFSSFWTLYLEGATEPLGDQDFYESRVWGRIFKRPPSYDFTFTMGSDLRKPFRLQTSLALSNAPQNNTFYSRISLIPRMRFSDHITVTLNMSFQQTNNDPGWVETQYDSLNTPMIFFGRRDIMTINNILDARYVFNTRLSLSLRVRHYWSQVNYLSFYTLNDEGYLDPSAYTKDHNINFNAFSADLQFIWYFAPGSELSVVWKNTINTISQVLEQSYFQDLSATLSSPQTNSFSVRILYYIDYLTIKNLFHKRVRDLPKNR